MNPEPEIVYDGYSNQFVDSSEKQVYTKNAVVIATFFAGPLVAAYMLSKNLEAFGDEDGAKQFLNYGAIGSFLLFTAVFFLPATIPLPNTLIPVLYTIAVHSYFTKSQEPAVALLLEKNTSKRGIGNILGVSAVSLLMMVVYMVMLLMILPERLFI